MNKELKSCPFCGSTCDVHIGIGDLLFFKCMNAKCGAVISFNNEKVSNKLAIKLFNKRH